MLTIKKALNYKYIQNKILKNIMNKSKTKWRKIKIMNHNVQEEELKLCLTKMLW